MARKLRARDPHAMADLYDRYGRLAYALIHRIVRNSAVAEDLVQETFLRVWNRVQSFDPSRGALGPWVLTVARNRAIDYLRSVDGRMSQSSLELDRIENPVFFLEFRRSCPDHGPRAAPSGRFSKALAQPAAGDRACLLRRTFADGDGGANETASGNRENLGPHRTEDTAGSARRGRHCMTCEELQDMFELYSLGVLERDESEELEAHLARGCSTCQDNFKRALSMNAALIGSSPDIAPSPKLKRRILASVGVQPRGWGWLGTFAAACLLVIALWLGNEERERGTELAEARQNIIAVTSQRDRLDQALKILDQPETVRVSFGKGLPEPPRGNVFIHSKLGVMLVASNLPKLTTGKTYEMWLIPKGGAPRPAGLFQPTDSGSALHVLSGPVDTSSLGAVAVTVEPEAGSPAPTTQPLITAVAGI